MSKPNIICFTTDQHRADHLGCYGNPMVRTPNIDRLSAEGVRFTESYVANPVCMPNRACWFTGQYPSAHGLTENGYTLSPSAVVLPEVLRQAGYRTASFGKIHLSPSGMTRARAKHEWELRESHERWNDHNDIPTPYYGLEEVKLVNSRPGKASQSYSWWLRENHPEFVDKLGPDSALEPQTGARESWKCGMPEELHYNTYIADRTIEYLRRYGADVSGLKSRNTDIADRMIECLRSPASDKPFFIWCSFPDPHHPYNPPKPWCDMYDPREIELSPARRDGELDDLPWFFRASYEGKLKTGGLGGNPSQITDDHYREIIAHTYGMISMVDANIGRVLAEMESQGLMENTIITFMTDHGDLMGDHWLINKGPYLFRGLVRVPTIWRLPAALRLDGSRRPSTGSGCLDPASGCVSDEMVSAVDVCPTLLELAGVDVPECVQGKSYAASLRGDAPDVSGLKSRNSDRRESVYIEYDESYISDRLRQIRTREWALTYLTQPGEGMLFDLVNDPGELHNLWNDPAHESVKRDLLFELLRTAVWAPGPPPPKPVHA